MAQKGRGVNAEVKRTGSLTVLQQAMGHASLAVSLGYLRNLEVPMLRVEDMPSFNKEVR